MADNADTGNGTTIVFSSTGFTALFTEIAAGDQTLDMLEDHHLNTTSGKKTKMPSDLTDEGELTGTYYWDQSFGTFPSCGTTETCTETFPLKSGESTNATLAGTGAITKRGGPTSQNGTLMTGTLTFTWDAKTGPTYTAGS